MALDRFHPQTHEHMATIMVRVPAPYGLNARLASLLVTRTRLYQCEILIQKDNYVVDGKNIIDLLTLGAGPHTRLCIRADGIDAQEAIHEIKIFFSRQAYPTRSIVKKTVLH